MAAQSHFSETFPEARQKFVAAATAAGAEVTSYEHPQQALNGTPLSCDTAWLGDPSAENVLVTVSATHGVEGYAGSAAQLASLANTDADQASVPTATLHIHGINPWGMDRLHRATENNVDLNRNFIDHGSQHPNNPDYGDLHPIVCPKTWNEDSESEIMRELDRYTADHSPARLVNGLLSGQYSHPQGLGFGGQQQEWSNLILQQIIQNQLSHAKRVLFIDWHTGLGGFGEAVFLCFNSKGSEEFTQVSKMYGAERISAEHFAESGTPRYQGLLCLSVPKALPAAKVLTLVVEFGTRGRSRVRPALMLDRWLQVEARPSGQKMEQWQSAIRDVFDPQDDSWRAAVTAASLEIMAQGYSGLRRWSK